VFALQAITLALAVASQAHFRAAPHLYVTERSGAAPPE
jgi:hypothetical protein